MKPLSIDILDEKWTDQLEPGEWRFPTTEAFEIVLSEYSELIEPDPWYLTEGYKADDAGGAEHLPINMEDSFDVLGCGEALGLIAVGMAACADVLESNVFECIAFELNEPNFKRGKNFVSFSWINAYRKEKGFEGLNDNEHNLRLINIMGRAEMQFFLKLQQGALEIYGMPSNSLKYQVIPREQLMYPMKINYLRNSIYFHDRDYDEGGFCTLNKNLIPMIKKEIENGSIPKEWLEIKIMKSDIQKLWPQPLLMTEKWETTKASEYGVSKNILTHSRERTIKKPPYKRAAVLRVISKMEHPPESASCEVVETLRKKLGYNTLDDETVREAIREYWAKVGDNH